MNLPADMRRALGLHDAGRVVVSFENDEVHITTASHIIKHAQELAAPYKSSGKRASDVLIAQRRHEVRQEEDIMSKN